MFPATTSSSETPILRTQGLEDVPSTLKRHDGQCDDNPMFAASPQDLAHNYQSGLRDPRPCNGNLDTTPSVMQCNKKGDDDSKRSGYPI